MKVSNEIRQLKCKDTKAYWNKFNMKNNVHTIQPTCSEFINMIRSLAQESSSPNEDLSFRPTAQTTNPCDTEEENNII